MFLFVILRSGGGGGRGEGGGASVQLFFFFSFRPMVPRVEDFLMKCIPILKNIMGSVKIITFSLVLLYFFCTKGTLVLGTLSMICCCIKTIPSIYIATNFFKKNFTPGFISKSWPEDPTVSLNLSPPDFSMLCPLSFSFVLMLLLSM